MNESLSTARSIVKEMMENAAVPQELVGEIALVDVLSLVETITDEAIKERVTAGATDDEDALRNMIEAIAVQAALACIQATIQEIGIQESTSTVDLGISPDKVTELFTALVRDGQATITLTTETEPS